MRNIKFRAWDEEKQEMIYQYGNTTKDNGVMEVQISFTDMGVSIFTKGYSPMAWEEVNSFKLMPYTGLKDKNNVLVYEGDILAFIAYDYRYIGEVRYIDSNYSLVCNDAKPFLSQILKGREFEVIGNIYEKRCNI